MEDKKRLIVIVGPTSSGKSDLAVKLARRFHGEIVSADSRQAYKGLNIGAGKITKKEMLGVPHHLLGVVSPKQTFSAGRYQKLALKAIKQVFQKGRIPFLVGGSPFYVYAATDGLVFPEVQPNFLLRKQLEAMPADALFQKLQKLDSERAGSIEQKNKRRLVRALEIVLATKKPVPVLQKHPLPYPVLFLGIKRENEELKKRICARLEKRFKQGMIAEVKKLKVGGLSWKRLESFGLEYRWIARFLQRKISRQAMIQSLKKDIGDFARRQMTWFKKDPRIRWIQNSKEALAEITNFMPQRIK
ncbi:MAG: tRNA (adenosine(37)-N6)-dimethylallyltransferase MiaA [Candidatus Wildermuthbacteria bacterium]|nr:tRNA (adenosine(37)-N6)-dimethylallyltransferase MiaA [Candidatus Wildermuthbacteria bacterium]